MSDTIPKIVDSLLKEPITYINGGGIAMSLMATEAWLKIGFYTVSIVASIVVIYKYYLEIQRLKRDSNQ